MNPDLSALPQQMAAAGLAGIWTLLACPVGWMLLAVIVLRLLVGYVGIVKRWLDDLSRRG